MRHAELTLRVAQLIEDALTASTDCTTPYVLAWRLAKEINTIYGEVKAPVLVRVEDIEGR